MFQSVDSLNKVHSKRMVNDYYLVKKIIYDICRKELQPVMLPKLV